MLGIGSSRSLTITGTKGSSASTPMRQSGMQVPWSSLRRCDSAGSKSPLSAVSSRWRPNAAWPEALAGKHLFHERLGRAVVLVADADADRWQVADEEVDPVIGADDDEQVRPAGLEPPPDLVEAGRQPVAVVSRHRLPIPRDDRPVTGREHTHEISHRPSLSRP